MTKGAIFVTGASTGIGRATVERLAGDGYAVIAGVRRDGDAPAAAAGHVLIDLAEPESVVAGAKAVLENTDGSLGRFSPVARRACASWGRACCPSCSTPCS